LNSWRGDFNAWRLARQGDRLEDPQQMEAEAARLLYVGMTQARDLLYVTYQSR
jgi:superfamily I DNA/RNA helicase